MKNVTGIEPSMFGLVLREEKGAALSHEEMDARISVLLDLFAFVCKEKSKWFFFYMVIQNAIPLQMSEEGVEIPASKLGMIGVEVDEDAAGMVIMCDQKVLNNGVVLDDGGDVLTESFVSGESEIPDDARFILFPAGSDESLRLRLVSGQSEQEA